jgi:hypothetical protein
MLREHERAVAPLVQLLQAAEEHVQLRAVRSGLGVDHTRIDGRLP